MIRQYQTRVDVIRNGATVTSLQPASDPNITCESSAEIKTSMGADFYDNADVNWLTDELKPYQIIDGEEFPVGVFMVATIVDSYDQNGVKVMSVEAYDRCFLLKETKTESMWFVPAGTNYIAAIEELLVLAGLSLWLSTPTTKTMATDREFEIGTSFLDIINTFLSEINYGSIWFDQNGFGVLQPTRSATAGNIDHQYGTTDGLRVLKRPCSRQVDIFNAPNVFIVVCQNPDLKEQLVSVAVNENPMSELSVFRRGRRIATVVSVDNVPDQETLDEYASELVFKSMLSEEVVTIATGNVPGHTVNNIVALLHPDISGLFQETGWSLTLAPGQEMQHTLRRAMLV